MEEIFRKVLNFTIQMPKESSFVTLCAGMVHHGMEFKADMTIQIEDGHVVDLKSILGIMTLCYSNGRRAQIVIEGYDKDDVEGAYACFQKYLKNYSQI